jgi:hypothetical protein
MSATTSKKVGLQPDTWLKHRSIYSESLITLQEATSENQAKLKAAKADGIHIDAMKMVSRLNRKDPAEAAVFIRAVLEGALVEKSAFMFQGDMLNGGSIADMFKTPMPSDKAAADYRDHEAFEIGHNEGLAGGSEDNLKAQFMAGSSALVAALGGFKRGRAFMQSTATPGIVKVAPTKGRRGGRTVNDKDNVERGNDNGLAQVPPRARRNAKVKQAAEPLPEPDDAEKLLEDETPTGEIDLNQVRKISVHKGAKLWNELTGATLKKFENKAVMLQKFEKLVASRSNGLAGASAY